MALEKVGLQAVIAGMPQFNQAADQIDRTYDRLSTGSERAAGRMSRLGDIAKTAIGVGVGMIGVQALKSFTGGLVSLVASAAPLADMETAARNLSETYGFAFDSMMESMRAASKGTIADSDLIASANKALIGSGQELGKQFGESLPRLLEIARASAKATGEDVGFLFESLVTGIKRGSPMIIDNTGLMLKLGEAQEAYAKSLGISVAEMTAEQKQIALLNATMEAGVGMVEAMGSETLTTAEKMARLRTTGKNLRDQFGKALVPVLDMILDLLIPIAETLASKVIPAMERAIIKVTNLAVALRSFSIGGFGRTLWDRFVPEWLEDVLDGLARGMDRVQKAIDEFQRGFAWAVEGGGAFQATLIGIGEALDDLLPERIMDRMWGFLEGVGKLGEAFGRLGTLDVRGFFEGLQPLLAQIFGEKIVGEVFEDLWWLLDKIVELRGKLPELQTQWATTMADIERVSIKTWNEEVIPTFDKAIEKIGELRDEMNVKFPEMDKLMLATAGIIGTALLYQILGPLGLVLAGVRVLRWAWERDWGGMQAKLTEAVDTVINPKLDELMAQLGAWRDWAIEKFVEVRTELGNQQTAWGQWAKQLSEEISTLRTEQLDKLDETWGRVFEGMTEKWGIFWNGFEPMIPPIRSFFDWWVADSLLPRIAKLSETVAKVYERDLKPAIKEIIDVVTEFLDKHPALKELLNMWIELVGTIAGLTVMGALLTITGLVNTAIDLLTWALELFGAAATIAALAVDSVVSSLDNFIANLKTAWDWVNWLWDAIGRRFHINLSITWPTPPEWLWWLIGRSTPPAVLDIRALNKELLQTARLLGGLGTRPMWNMPVPAAASTQQLATYQTTNVWSPQVNASYQQVQSPTGVMQDMETLAILYRMG